MLKNLRRFAVVAVAAVLVAGVVATSSYAQPRFNRGGVVVFTNSQAFVNPYYRVAPGLSLNQYAYNLRTIGRAYYNVPPWMYGYNPYPPPIIYTPYYPYPYPYSPYSPYGMYGPYSPYGVSPAYP